MCGMATFRSAGRLSARASQNIQPLRNCEADSPDPGLIELGVGQKTRRSDSPDQSSSDEGPNSGATGQTAAYAVPSGRGCGALRV